MPERLADESSPITACKGMTADTKFAEGIKLETF
jgi:hypothetical protein